MAGAGATSDEEGGVSTKIEWTDETWNPVTGCTKISEACGHCYAERMSHRLAGRYGYPADEPFRVALHPDKLAQPIEWKKPRRIFVVSMGDLFHEDVPDEYIAAVFGVMAACPQHTFQVLTKRPERALEWFRAIDADPIPPIHDAFGKLVECKGCDAIEDCDDCGICQELLDAEWPLPNVWIGVTAEYQDRADERIPTLLQIPAAVRFVSVEPMLGAVYLRQIHTDTTEIDSLTGDHGVIRPLRGRSDKRLDWVICGGETGPGARPMHPDWASGLRDQCIEAGVPFFFKGWGEWFPWNQIHPLSRESTAEIRAEMAKPSVYNRQTYFGFRPVAGPDGPVSGTTPGATPESIYPVGKKSAGRELDGRTWEQFPEVSP